MTMASPVLPVALRPARRPASRTVGDLRRAGTPLEFICNHCSVSRLFDPFTLPFGNLQNVATAHRRMRCSFCGHTGEGAFTRAASDYRAEAADALAAP